LGYGELGTKGSQQNIACVDALANLGAQCQTIKQNAECFALSRYGKLAGLLQGAQIPTGVRTTATPSGLGALSTVGATVGGIMCKYPDLLKKIKEGLESYFPSSADTSAGVTVNPDDLQPGKTGVNPAPPPPDESAFTTPYRSSGIQSYPLDSAPPGGNANLDSASPGGDAKGGSIRTKKIGCSSLRRHGGLPRN
jgi:hypothetical protein